VTLARAALLTALVVLVAPGAALAGDGPQTKIINGTPADAGEYPAQGFLEIDADGNGSHESFCGGTLVGGRQFLTAAHCATNGTTSLPASRFIVFLGDNDLAAPNAPSDFFSVVMNDVNSAYTGGPTPGSDTAMLTLGALPPESAIPLISTGERSLWGTGTTATIIGWGSTGTASSSNQLLEANVPIVSDSTCATDYPGKFNPATMVCAADGSHDTCQGDSGGPLMVPRGPDGLVLAGVTSWGINCAEASHPGVYARVGAEPLHSWVTSRFPHVGFTSSPGSPRAGDPVSLDAGISSPAGYFASFSWDLDGDGQYDDATGTTVSRGFPEGTHSIGVQANGVGTEKMVSRAVINVGAPPSDVAAPLISSASASPTAFAVDRKGRAEKAVSSAKKGTNLRYTLSEQGRVVFTVERALPGRRSRTKCVKETRKNRGKRKCTRYTRFGRFAVASVAGSNSHRYKGRIGGHAMKPGSYRATLVATDTAGNRSKAKALKLRVVSR
jgi:hypothetical protein